MTTGTAIVARNSDLALAGPLGSLDAYLDRVSRIPVLSREEEKELAALESEIQEGERRQAEIEAELANNSSDAYLVHQLYQEREMLIAKLAGAMDRWAELARTRCERVSDHQSQLVRQQKLVA